MDITGVNSISIAPSLRVGVHRWSNVMYRIAYPTPASIVGALVLLAGTCIPVGAANAATRVVGNCNDSGVGSLRAVVAAAASGDVIDLRSLTCSKILLTSGSIAVPQASLTILGRTRYGLTIDGNRNDRVFLHTGTGTLRIDHVSVANGQRIVIPESPDRSTAVASTRTETSRSIRRGCARAAPCRAASSIRPSLRRRHQRRG